MTGTEFHAPQRLEDALGLMARGGVRAIAGGTDFYPALGPGGPHEDLLDITRIDALRGITQNDDGGWRIGAATTWSEIAAARALPPGFDALKAAAREIGAVQIQNAGTLAGNLCNASPAADGVPPLLLLEAEVELARAGERRRRLALQDFLTGVRATALAPDELLLAVHLPALPEAVRSGFHKLGSRRYLVISIAMVAVMLRCDGGGRIDLARVAVGACSPVARRLSALERALIGQRPGDVKLRAGHLDGLAPIDDVRASAVFRRDAAGEMIARLVRELGDG